MAYGTAERAWTYDEYVDKYEKLEKENTRLSKALNKYGFHLPPCDVWRDGDCTCGFHAAWKEGG